VVAINSGGTAVGNFAADKDVATNGTWTFTTTNAIDTTGVTNPVPQAVDQSQRVGAAIAYTIPGLTPGAAYTVRLDFAELYWTSKGQRLINVSINNAGVLANLDVFAVAGARYKAVADTFNAVAGATGTIAITLTAARDYAALNAVQIGAASGATPAPTPTPTAPAAAFNDYPTLGYDNQRDVFNPNSTAITPANLSKLHVAWQASLNDYNTLTQPVLATAIPGHAGVLYVGGGSGTVYGYDALKGTLLWKTATGQMVYSACGGTSFFGVGGTAAYDPASKSLYIVGNSNPATDAYAANQLFRLDGATGSILGRVNFAPAAAGSTSELNFTHTAVALSNGVAYAGTGSTCDISSWRGTVAAISVPAMTSPIDSSRCGIRKIRAAPVSSPGAAAACGAGAVSHSIPRATF
jgi:outer membrane protein assembly factor BamB